jgi:transposase
MYFDSAVKIPSAKGKIITKKKGSATYILYQYGQSYNPDKKYAIPQRAIIGKINLDDPDTMFPNERFTEFFPAVTLPEEVPDSYRSCALRIGSYAIIKKVLDDYKIPDLLRKYFKEDTELLLDLVAYILIEEENAGQYYPDYAYGHALFSVNMRIYSDSKVCRFLKSVKVEQTIGFLDDWNKSRNQKGRVYISYDSTNKNCSAGDIDILEFGKPKVDVGDKILNLAIAFDTANRVPLFYEEYPGSITDVAQFTYMVNKASDYHYKDVGFILDRGYFSKDNIRYMEANDYAFIIMVKGRKELVSSLVEANLHSFEADRECSIRSYRVYGKTVKGKLFEDDTHERYFHIYYNPSKQSAEREMLEQDLERCKQDLEKHIGTTATFGTKYHKYFHLKYTKNGVLHSYAEQKEVIRKELLLCGYFCIVTSEEMTASQALIHYKGRDVSEKLFKADKSYLGSRTMRVQSRSALSAKIFIEFIALIVRNRIYNLLREAMLKLEKRPNYMTVPAALRELEKIEMVRRNGNHYRLDHAVTKRQKIILSSFGMDDNNIRELATEIGNILAGSPASQQPEKDEEENNDGTDTFDSID